MASVALCGLYAQGGPGWWLGFVALVPWLRGLDATASLGRALLAAWAMSVGFTLAVFYWFGAALGQYTQIGTGLGLAGLLLAAPLLQPQFLSFALVRHLARRAHGPALSALLATAAWVATEWLAPHGLGDTLGHGLYPAPWLRQAAELVGATGLTALLLLANEALSQALSRRPQGARARLPALAVAALLPLLTAAYGAWRLHTPPNLDGAIPVRLGLVQANITDYERRRREDGAAAVVREVLDTHFAMSYDAIERRGADAVLWSETVYPTTFGHPKSEAGAALDAEIRTIVDAAGVPFIFGTYDRDGDGEYNAAALVQPGEPRVARYRKTRLFPFTEALPAWLDTPAVRAALPGAGHWRAGDGARVLALRLRGGREVPVLPLICLDDTDPRLAIDGARLGAQLILTMSNDEWFTAYPQGAALHQAVAAFRSIETGLPQFRVTTNGLSAVIDARGALLATSRMGERTLVIGELPARDPAPTLMVRWGDWVGRAAALLLAGWVMLGVWTRLRPANTATTPWVPSRTVVATPAVRCLAGGLRLLSRAGAVVLAADWLWGGGSLTGNTLALLRAFAALCLLPEAAAAWLLLASRAEVQLQDGQLTLRRGPHQLQIAAADIASLRPWRLPLPGTGATLRLHGGPPWPPGLMLRDPWALAAALRVPVDTGPARLSAYLRSLAQRPRTWLDHAAVQGLLLPLLLAVPAFLLHQNIAYGSPLGELYSFGLTAYLRAFGLWWAAWIAGVAVYAAVLRLGVEALALTATCIRPAGTRALRPALETAMRALLYAGLPALLLWRALG